MTLIPATTHRLDPLRWLGLPTLACIVATILLATPIRIFGLQLPEPVFPLVPAFAWAVIRPSILAPFALMLMGLFLDLFWGGIVGLWVVSLLAAYTATFSIRRVLSGLGFWGLGGWYAVSVGVALGMAVMMSHMQGREIPGAFALLWQVIVALALFPLANLLIERFEDADVRFR
jgi:rod shape-determining protein MreD